MSEFLTTKEVIDFLDVSRRTVQAWVKGGKLNPAKDVQGRNLFSIAEVKALCDTVKPQKVELEPVESEMPSQEEKKVSHAVEPAQCSTPNAAQVTFTFDPKSQMIIDREHYEGLLIRYAQLEVEKRQLAEKVQLLEDKKYREEGKRRPWWKRIFGGKGEQ